MHVDLARKILLVRAVETVDTDGVLLTDSMQRNAERRAREDCNSADDPERFFAERAEKLYQDVSGDSSLLRLAGRPFRYRNLLIATFCLVALVIGIGLNELGSGRTINILAAPILVLIAWNVLMCLIASISLLIKWRTSGTGGLGSWLSDVFHWLIERLSLRQSRSGRKARLAAHAAQEFYGAWFTTGRRLHVSQIRLILHMVAALLVIGAIGGMYWRGFAYEYQATWESTFFDAGGVRKTLAFVLGPASAIMGNPIPDVQSIEAMQSSPVPAAEWIHRYALTTILFVIIPRGLLASFDVVRLRRLRNNFPLDWQADPYFLALLAPDRGEGTQVVIHSYSFQPAARSLEALKHQLRIYFGNQCDLQVADSLEYGEDIAPSDESPTTGGETSNQCHVVIFNASQTPENEVHGNLITQFAEAAAAQKGTLFVIIDETAFIERLGDDPQFDDRLQQRRTAWRTIGQQQGIELYMGTLETFNPGNLSSGS
ncbi:MAG: DUF2868 domain-containing protein [Planctomycetes bacterium]|nr:DUF2868 domain-containing protein [Planctomycetota bacterium]